ncbi:hypothetical protein O6H91_01G087100 [Diphasiastrum complanatum]|uniref:Uncharacterized protein n=1 Tax=Diphasiastrum complanatum TaxID=34168 RepID=A0ACC2ET42_DIPCM|nr:hypothetical protein O6H91_Y494900 [Diphasiastrum complanatum]KAJ7569651.1 hypothetical protein O6H91_01G087100 [Diphasiastrum complanatum]
MQEGLCPEEVLKAVFPLLNGEDLASCMCVAKLWRDAAKEDYLWKRLCSCKWPSTCQDSSPLAIGTVRGFHKLYANFARKYRTRPLPSPKLSFQDLEFYVDVWVGDCSAYSTIVPGPVVQSRIGNPPAGICESMQNHLRSQAYKMTIPVSPRFQVCFNEDVCMSLLIRRRDDERIACLVGRSRFAYIDGPEYRAHAFDYLRISSLYPFVSEIRAWVALLLVDANGGTMEVFGIELDFLDAANSDIEALCLLEILDWK